MSHYSKGRKFEYDVRDILIQQGADVSRSAGSKTPKDIIAVFPGPIIWYVQCKTDGKLSKGEREALLSLEKTYGIVPILAFKEGNGVKFLPIRSLKPNFGYEIINGKFTKKEND